MKNKNEQLPRSIHSIGFSGDQVFFVKFDGIYGAMLFAPALSK